MGINDYHIKKKTLKEIQKIFYGERFLNVQSVRENPMEKVVTGLGCLEKNIDSDYSIPQTV